MRVSLFQPSKLNQNSHEIVTGACRQRHPLSGHGMFKAHGSACQQQTPAAVFGSEESIVDTLTVGAVPDDRMTNVFHVPAQLVFTAGARSQLDQRIAGLRISIHFDGQLDLRQPLKMCNRRLGRFIDRCLMIGHSIRFLPQGMIDHTVVGTMASHNGEVTLIHLPGRKLLR